MPRRGAAPFGTPVHIGRTGKSKSAHKRARLDVGCSTGLTLFEMRRTLEITQEARVGRQHALCIAASHYFLKKPHFVLLVSDQWSKEHPKALHSYLISNLLCKTKPAIVFNLLISSWSNLFIKIS